MPGSATQHPALPAEPQPTPLAGTLDLTRIAMFAALIGAGAFLHIPFGPSHISFQTMMVMLAGFCLGPKKAALALLAYLACGFIGLPMFGRGRAGPASFIGPTAGYFAGFWLGAIIAGLSTFVHGGRKKRIAAMLVCGGTGSVIILLLGAAWLHYSVLHDWKQALIAGFLPFLPGDLLKMALAAAVKEMFFPNKGQSHD